MAKQKNIIGLYVLFNICLLVSMTFAHYDQQQQATHYSQKQPATVKTHSHGQQQHHHHHSSSKTTQSYSYSGSTSSSYSYASMKAAHPQQQTGKPAHPVKPAKPTPLPHKGKPSVPVKKPSPVPSIVKPSVPVKKHVKPCPPPPTKTHKPSVPVIHKPAPSYPQSPTKNSPVTVKPNKPAPLPHKPTPAKSSPVPAPPDHNPNPYATTPIPPKPKHTPSTPQPTQETPPSTSTPLKPTQPTPAAIQSGVDFKNSFKDVYVFGESSSDTGNGYSVGGIQPYVYSTDGTSISRGVPSIGDVPSLGNGGRRGKGRSQSSFGLGGTSLDFVGAKSGFSKGKRFYGSASGNFGGGHRLSNGGLVVDYMTKDLAVKNPVPYTSISGGGGAADGGCINFAIAGASSLSADFYKSHKAGHAFMFKEIPQTFQTQIDWFAQVVAEKIKKLGQRKCQEDIANTLFWVGGIGANDYSRMFGSDVNGQFINEASVNLVTKMVKTLVKDGAQYIMVQGLAPIGCTPSQLSLCSSSDRDDSNCSAQANAIIKSHNSLLQQKLQVFRELYPKCTIVYGDTYAAYLHILKNHASFGFTEPFKACCGAPTSPTGKSYNFDADNMCGTNASSQCQDSTKYISWDGIHLTDTMNKYVADLLLHKGFCHPPFDEIVRKKKGIY